MGLPGAGLATARGVQSSLWGHLSGQSAQTWGSLTGTREVQTPCIGSHHASGQEHDSFPPESVNGRPVLVDRLDLLQTSLTSQGAECSFFNMTPTTGPQAKLWVRHMVARLPISAPADGPSCTEMLGWRPLHGICSSRTEECSETAGEPVLSLPCRKSAECQQNVQLFLLTRPRVGWGESFASQLS